MLKNIIRKRLGRFVHETDGFITLEAVVLFPALLFIFAASWVYFDVFRQHTINQKANYTIGDALSRETDPINDRYIENARNLLYMLNKSEADISDLRITVVEYSKNGNKYTVEWSEARGDYEPLETSDLSEYTHRLPILAHGDQIILVETWDWYDPVFSVGLAAYDIQTYSFTRPRYAPQLLHEEHMKGNNGWGNGDQIAPGGSLCNNNAENVTDCLNDDGSENQEPSNKGQAKQFETYKSDT